MVLLTHYSCGFRCHLYDDLYFYSIWLPSNQPRIKLKSIVCLVSMSTTLLKSPVPYKCRRDT